MDPIKIIEMFGDCLRDVWSRGDSVEDVLEAMKADSAFSHEYPEWEGLTRELIPQLEASFRPEWSSKDVEVFCFENGSVLKIDYRGWSTHIDTYQSAHEFRETNAQKKKKRIKK